MPLRRLPDAAAQQGLSTDALRKRILRQQRGAKPLGGGPPIRWQRDELGHIWVEVNDITPLATGPALLQRARNLLDATDRLRRIGEELAEDVARYVQSHPD